MSNIAYLPSHSADAVPVAPQGSTRGPQVEDGYTRIANELYEVVNNAHACPVNARHLRVIHAIIRRTYGFNKTMDSLADTQLAADTGIPRNKVNTAKHELLAMKVLKLSIDGRKIGVNKIYSEWDFTARPERKAPKSKTGQNGNGVTKMVTQEVTKEGTHKRQKDNDMNTYVFIADRLAANQPIDLSKLTFSPLAQTKQKKSKLPACPQMALLDLWAEIMPDKRQPVRSMWSKSQRAKNLSARWRQGFGIKNEQTGKRLYTDTAAGLEWWGRFFRFLRKSEFLMRDESRWFGLDWVAEARNFEKIMELKFHGGDA